MTRPGSQRWEVVEVRLEARQSDASFVLTVSKLCCSEAVQKITALQPLRWGGLWKGQEVALPAFRPEQVGMMLSQLFSPHPLFFFLFCHICGMQKFPGQVSNPCHSNDLSHCSDNTRPLTA